MRIGVTSQNFRTITGHAGKTRRFLVFEASAGTEPREVERLDLPMEMSLHEYHGDDHPLFGLDALITQGHGQGFAQRLTRHGVRVIATSASDPLAAAMALAAGQPLPEPMPHDHDHDHDHGHGQEAGHAQAHPVGAGQIPVTLGK
jgi:ABC-type nickel/cobalt efflux system permease component RcnA